VAQVKGAAGVGSQFPSSSDRQGEESGEDLSPTTELKRTRAEKSTCVEKEAGKKPQWNLIPPEDKKKIIRKARPEGMSTKRSHRVGIKTLVKGKGKSSPRRIKGPLKVQGNEVYPRELFIEAVSWCPHTLLPLRRTGGGSIPVGKKEDWGQRTSSGMGVVLPSLSIPHRPPFKGVN